MTVRTYIVILLLCAISGAVGLATIVGEGFRRNELAAMSSGRSSDFFQRVESFVATSNELLAAADAEMYSAKGTQLFTDRLGERCERDLKLVAELLPADASHFLDDLKVAMALVKDRVGFVALRTEIGDVRDAAIEAYDDAASNLLDAVDSLETYATSRAEHETGALVESHSRTRWWIAIAAACYLLLLAGAFKWSSHRLVVPLQNLSHAADESLRRDVPFHLDSDGPVEVRSLNESVGAFIASLEARVNARTAELHSTNSALTVEIAKKERAQAAREAMEAELMAASRKAGMAEIATNVLHNVGNVLNSVNVSATIASEKVRKSPVKDLVEVVALLSKHNDDVGEYLSVDATGKMVPQFLQAIAEHLSGAQEATLAELDRLAERVDHIKEIVRTQQSYAKTSNVSVEVSLVDLLEDALHMNSAGLARHGVEVERDFEDLPLVLTDRHKVLQIVTNLIGNAKHAVTDGAGERGTIELGLALADGEDEFVGITVRDNGCGIPGENLTKIFVHGFTTKRDGHGFGLHGASNAAKELGGTLTVQSDGSGCGATFTLKIPAKFVEVVA